MWQRERKATKKLKKLLNSQGDTISLRAPKSDEARRAFDVFFKRYYQESKIVVLTVAFSLNRMVGKETFI